MTAHQGQSEPDTPRATAPPAVTAPVAASPKPLAPDAPLRVILVGRTGLDAALRLDSAIELIRARNPLEALGELSDPIDESSPAEVTVVVGADAAVGQYASDFVEGLRLIEPRVRIYSARADEEPAPDHESTMDGVIDPRKSADVIRRAVRGLGPGPAAAAPARSSARAAAGPPARQVVGGGTQAAAAAKASAVPPLKIFDPEPATNGHARASHDRAPAARDEADEKSDESDDPPRPIIVTLPRSTDAPLAARADDKKPSQVSGDEATRSGAPDPKPARPADPAAHAADHAGEPEADSDRTPDESTVLDAMLTGGDVMEAVLDVVRVKTGAHDVVFIPGEGDPLVGAKVEYRHRPLGVLRSVHASREELARHAEWVARWIVLRDQHNQLRTAAMTDDLTGAYNRRYFTRFLAAAMDQARRNRTGVTLLAFDIDDFKVYNDRYGHAAGDEILTEVVRLLKSVIRPTDRVCRTGGDEFVVIFHEPTGPREKDSRPPTSIFEIAKRFQRQVCEHHFPKLLEEAPGTLTISGGLATYPWDGRTAEELLERADQLAFESKRQGKNAITLGPGAQRVCGVWD